MPFGVNLKSLLRRCVLRDSATDQEDAARMVAVNATPGRGDQQIDRTIAIDVAHAHGVEPESVAGYAAGVSLQKTSVPARIEIRPAGRIGLSAELPCAYDQIRTPVAVHIACDGFTRAKILAGGLARQSEQ